MFDKEKDLDLYIAHKKFRIHSDTKYFAYVSTVWRGEWIMFTYDKVFERIFNAYSTLTLDEDETEKLVGLFKYELSQ